MKISCKDFNSAEMQVLLHHIYEYNKGLRSLVLHTMNAAYRERTEELLNRKGIEYIVQEVSKKKINVFFGEQKCIRVLESFNKKSILEFNDEEDFILGIMLGYDRTQQYERYLKRTNNKKLVVKKTA